MFVAIILNVLIFNSFLTFKEIIDTVPKSVSEVGAK